MIQGKRINIVPFDMKYLKDYFDGFNEEITKFQWPDPFKSIDTARDALQEFLNEMEREETLFFPYFQRTVSFLGALRFMALLGIVRNWASG